MIKLRIKSLSDGKKSFYLDIYFKGTRSYEFLNLYVEPNLCGKQANNKQYLLNLCGFAKAKPLRFSYNERFYL